MATLTPWVKKIGNIQSRRLLCRIYPAAQMCWQKRSERSLSSDEVEATQSRPHPKPTTKAVTISRAMRAYMTRAKAYSDMMAAEVADYEIGKRHLANIMGEDPDNFTQEDVDRAIAYLLPSGLFDKKARPMMKDPFEIFPKRKAAQFGLDGRPQHFMYFTTLPNYYNLLYDIAWKMEDLKEMEDKLRAEGRLEEELESNKMVLSSSQWISEIKFSDRLVEKVQTKEYQHFLVLMERLASLPLGFKEEEFIMSFRSLLFNESNFLQAPPIDLDSEGRAFSTANGRKKRCNATVKVYKPGSGKFLINGQDLSFFKNLLLRETLLNPLIVTNLLGAVDVVAEVDKITDDPRLKHGPSSQAGAIRIAMSQALLSYVDDNVKEQLRLSGLLTPDPRTKERKKPGQEKARKKFTWKKR